METNKGLLSKHIKVRVSAKLKKKVERAARLEDRKEGEWVRRLIEAALTNGHAAKTAAAHVSPTEAAATIGPAAAARAAATLRAVTTSPWTDEGTRPTACRVQATAI